MAKPITRISTSATVSVLLKHSVTIGEGEEAVSHPPDSTVVVSPELADEIVDAGAGTYLGEAIEPSQGLIPSE